MGKVLRRLKEKATKSKSERPAEKFHTSGPISPSSPDGARPHDNTESRSAVNVEDDDLLIDIGEQEEGADISVEIQDVGEDDADEDPWEPDRHPQTLLVDDAA